MLLSFECQADLHQFKQWDNSLPIPRVIVDSDFALIIYHATEILLLHRPGWIEVGYKTKLVITLRDKHVGHLTRGNPYGIHFSKRKFFHEVTLTFTLSSFPIKLSMTTVKWPSSSFVLPETLQVWKLTVVFSKKLPNRRLAIEQNRDWRILHWVSFISQA